MEVERWDRLRDLEGHDDVNQYQRPFFFFEHLTQM